MKIRETFFKQFSKPSGQLGRLVGWIMAIKNKNRLHWGIEKLQHQPEQAILEIGFGPGSFIEILLTQHSHTGLIAGIDISDVMLQQASQRNSLAIAQGQVQLKLASVEALPFSEHSFDRIFTSNTSMFWPNPVENIKEIARVMKQHAILCITLQPYWAKDEEGVRAEAEKLKIQMHEAGLKNIQVDFKAMRPVSCLCATAVKD